jgi:hypothetical protein
MRRSILLLACASGAIAMAASRPALAAQHHPANHPNPAHHSNPADQANPAHHSNPADQANHTDPADHFVDCCPSAIDGAPALHVRANRGRRVVTFEIGPMTLPAGGGYADAMASVTAYGTIPVNGWIRGATLSVLAGDGRRLGQHLVHHAGLYAPGERDVFTPVMRRIVAFGTETAPLRLPGDLGYRVQPGDSVLIVAALFNAGEAAIDDVYVRLTLDYADAARDVRHRDVLPLYMDVMPPGPRSFDVPPGGVQRSWEWSPVVPGRILALGGHLHEHAIELILEDVTAGVVLWRGRALYDEQRNLIGVKRKVFATGLRVQPTHVYRLTAVYGNDTGATVRGAMGMLGGLFLPDPGARMPPADRYAAEYRADLDGTVSHTHQHH